MLSVSTECARPRAWQSRERNWIAVSTLLCYNLERPDPFMLNMKTRSFVPGFALLAVPAIIFTCAMFMKDPRALRPFTAADLPALTNYMHSITTNQILRLEYLQPTNGLLVVFTDYDADHEKQYFVCQKQRGWETGTSQLQPKSHEQIWDPQEQKLRMKEMLRKTEEALRIRGSIE
jgi:hypothetical protein